MESNKRELAFLLKTKPNRGQRAAKQLKTIMHASLSIRPIVIPLRLFNLAGLAKVKLFPVGVRNRCYSALRIAGLSKFCRRNQRSIVKAYFRHPSSPNFDTLAELA
jgi:hypothetical protein